MSRQGYKKPRKTTKLKSTLGKTMTIYEDNEKRQEHETEQERATT